MYKEVLRSIENVEIWPSISLIIFFLLFIGVLIYVIRSDREFIKKMKEMPLDDGTAADKEKNKEREPEKTHDRS